MIHFTQLLWHACGSGVPCLTGTSGQGRHFTELLWHACGSREPCLAGTAGQGRCSERWPAPARAAGLRPRLMPICHPSWEGSQVRTLAVTASGSDTVTAAEAGQTGTSCPGLQHLHTACWRGVARPRFLSYLEDLPVAQPGTSTACRRLAHAWPHSHSPPAALRSAHKPWAGHAPCTLDSKP